MFSKKKIKRNAKDVFLVSYEQLTGITGLEYESEESFMEDIESLIEHGFLDCVDESRGLYSFSDRWKEWTEDNYSVPEEVMTEHMKNLAMAKMP